jgi:hypothetical protein
LAVIERGEGVAIAAKREVDALVAGLLEVGKDDGASRWLLAVSCQLFAPLCERWGGKSEE